MIGDDENIGKVLLISHQSTVPLSLAMLTSQAGPVLSVFKFDIGHNIYIDHPMMNFKTV